MSRFLIAVWSLESHVNPNLAVAAALREAGHEVAFYAGPKASIEIEGNGFRVFPFQALREDVASVQFAALLEDQRNARKLSQHFSHLLVSQLVPQVDDLNQIIDAWSPDVLTTDMAIVAPFAILQDLRKVRVAVLSHVGYCMIPGPHGPVPGRALPPRDTLAGRLRAGAIARAANFITRDVPKAIDATRQSYGLPKTGLRITELHPRANLLLIPSVPELDYNRSDLPPTVCYVGSLAWPPPEIIPPKSSVIAVEEGGYYRKDPFLLRTAIEALSKSSFDVRLSPGRDRDPALFGELSPNVKVHRDTPEAELVITTGNTESVLRALSRGIPLIIVPSLLDQAEMAWRIKLFGAGEFIEEKNCTPSQLRETLTTVLTVPHYKKKAEEAATLIHARGGALNVVRELERLAASR